MSQIKVTEILLCRHAESVNNVAYVSVLQQLQQHEQRPDKENIIALENKVRDPDCNISERGTKELILLEDYLSTGALAHLIDPESYDNTSLKDWIVLSSPMKRCLITAKAFSKGLNKPVYVQHNLYESGGCYELNNRGKLVGLKGATKAEVERNYPNFRCLKGMEDGWYAGHDKVEVSDEFKVRVRSIAQWLWGLHHATPEERQIENIHFKNMMLVIHGNLLMELLTVICGPEVALSLPPIANTGCTLLRLCTNENGKPYHHTILYIRF